MNLSGLVATWRRSAPDTNQLRDHNAAAAMKKLLSQLQSYHQSPIQAKYPNVCRLLIELGVCSSLKVLVEKTYGDAEIEHWNHSSY